MVNSEPEGRKSYGEQLRHQYLSLARLVLKQPDLDYNSLYWMFAGNDWACQRLDREVARLALSHQSTPTEAAYLMAQSPYSQYQISEKGLKPESLLTYAKSVVAYSLAQMRLSYPQEKKELVTSKGTEKNATDKIPVSTQTLWDKYSQGVKATVPAQLTQAVARKALRDGLPRETIGEILKADPEYKRIESSLGEAKAAQYAQLALSAAVRLERLRQQPGLSQQRSQHRERAPEMEL